MSSLVEIIASDILCPQSNIDESWEAAKASKALFKEMAVSVQGEALTVGLCQPDLLMSRHSRCI